ncbi:winged helix-turn-helix domain-containing protein [Bradyrhizobium sp. dw_411]|uniref:winged helix-turn-helix domain-containing protein n=1 Tax=Bradyrhizobium sp. dw_411 TaxID=2720082 RepID=UPI001BD0B6DC|nr:winged helix-turn-helix domain-containing protein [Bradyrhizobium sp. dw_411]
MNINLERLQRERSASGDRQEKRATARGEGSSSRSGITQDTFVQPLTRAMKERLWEKFQENEDILVNALFIIVESVTSLDRAARIEAPPLGPDLPRVTLRRVGSLELDLLDRTARRGERTIELLPREYRLLDFMMQRSNELLTRAMLFKEVWNYKFVPTTNLVDVHMSRLRRKVDMPNEAPMIESIRGAGFILRAWP